MSFDGVMSKIGAGVDVANAAGGLFTGGIRQRRAQKYAIHNARNQYKWAVEGMEAAGINPVLAFASGHGVNMPQGASQGPGVGTSALSASNLARKQASKVESEKEVLDATKFKLEAEAAVARGNAAAISLDNLSRGFQLPEKYQQMKWFRARMA